MITEREIRKAAEKLKNNKSPFSDKIRNEMIKASIDTLMPVYENYLIQFLTKGPCHRLGVVVLLLPSINRADEAIRQKIPMYLCLQLPGKTILFCLKPTTSRVYRFFEYAPKISNWLFTE